MSAKSNYAQKVMSVKSNYAQTVKEEGSEKSRATVEGEYLGKGLKKFGQWLGNAWDDVKQVAGDFLDGVSSATTGKTLEENFNAAKDQIKNSLNKFHDYVEEKTGKDIGDHVNSLFGGTSSQTGSTAKPIVYSDWSPAAQKFGMDQQTAYSEHMANTAHQREVADLRAAGLNPVLGAGSGASGVTGHVATSGSSAQKSLNGDYIVDAIGATAAVVTAILTKNPAYGYMAGNAVNSVGDMFTKTK